MWSPLLSTVAVWRQEGEARAILERSLGRPISEVFSHWDDTPLGIASIGQAHRATLKNGREVVNTLTRFVKYPPCLPASLPPCLPASLPPCLPASLPPCLPASLPPCLPASLRPWCRVPSL
jgi:hypothetical protein